MVEMVETYLQNRYTKTQINEAVLIELYKDQTLNSKSEYNRCQIPRLNIKMGDRDQTEKKPSEKMSDREIVEILTERNRRKRQEEIEPREEPDRKRKKVRCRRPEKREAKKREAEPNLGQGPSVAKRRKKNEGCASAEIFKTKSYNFSNLSRKEPNLNFNFNENETASQKCKDIENTKLNANSIPTTTCNLGEITGTKNENKANPAVKQPPPKHPSPITNNRISKKKNYAPSLKQPKLNKYQKISDHFKPIIIPTPPPPENPKTNLRPVPKQPNLANSKISDHFKPIIPHLPPLQPLIPHQIMKTKCHAKLYKEPQESGMSVS